MKTLLTFILALFSVTAVAQTLSYRNLNANQFGSNNFTASLKNGAPVTNLVFEGNATRFGIGGSLPVFDSSAELGWLQLQADGKFQLSFNGSSLINIGTNSLSPAAHALYIAGGSSATFNPNQFSTSGGSTNVPPGAPFTNLNLTTPTNIGLVTWRSPNVDVPMVTLDVKNDEDSSFYFGAADPGSIGIGTVAIGNRQDADGNYSTIIGNANVTYTHHSVVMGNNNDVGETTGGDQNSIFGIGNYVGSNNTNAVVLGRVNLMGTVNKTNLLAIGSANLVTEHNSGAIGYSLENLLENSIDLGVNNTVKTTFGTTGVVFRVPVYGAGTGLTNIGTNSMSAAAHALYIAGGGTNTYRISPSGGDDTILLRTAVTNSKLVELSAGTFLLTNTIVLPSGTVFRGAGPLTILHKSVDFSHVFANSAAYSYGTNSDSDIEISDLTINCNAGGTQTGAAAPTANGHIQFTHVRGVTLTGVTITNYGAVMYAIHFQNVTNGLVSGVVANGARDGVHLTSGCNNIIIEHCDLTTGDDAIAINAVDFARVQNSAKDINWVTIRNCSLHGNTSGGGNIATYVGSWTNWVNGNTYMNGQMTLNAGKIYKEVGFLTNVASVAPTHTVGDVTGADGITWRFLEAGTNLTANITHVLIDNVSLDNLAGNNNMEVKVYGSSDANYSVYPGTEGTALITDFRFAGVREGYPVKWRESGAGGFLNMNQVSLGKIVFVDDSYVGINTTNPVAQLDVNPGMRVGLDTTTDNQVFISGTGGGIDCWANAGTSIPYFRYFGNAGTLWGGFYAFGSSDTLSELFVGKNETNVWQVWKADGKVGIGTTTPPSLFSIVSSVGKRPFSAVAPDGTDVSGFNFIFDNQDGNAVHANGLLARGGGLASTAFIFSAQDYNSNTVFGVTGTGDIGIGIGTTPPVGKLDVNGTARVTELFVTNGITLGGVRRTDWPASGDSFWYTNTAAASSISNAYNAQLATLTTTGDITNGGLATSQFVATDSNKKLVSTLNGASLTNLTLLYFSAYNNESSVSTDESSIEDFGNLANQISADGTVFVGRAAGTFVNSTSTKRLRLYYQEQIIFDTGAITVTGETSWDLESWCVRDTSSTARCSTKLNLSGASTGAYANRQDVTNINYTVTFGMVLTGTSAGAGVASGDIVKNMAYSEIKRPSP